MSDHAKEPREEGFSNTICPFHNSACNESVGLHFLAGPFKKLLKAIYCKSLYINCYKFMK